MSTFASQLVCIDEVAGELLSVNKFLNPNWSRTSTLCLLFSGQKWQDKILVVRNKLKSKNASAVVFTALDEIACELLRNCFTVLLSRRCSRPVYDHSQ